jgi:hypothetical protein
MKAWVGESRQKQLKPRVAWFIFAEHTKTGKNIPKLQPLIPNGRNMYKNGTKNYKCPSYRYTNIFRPKIFPKYTKLAILVWKQTIWQPWLKLDQVPLKRKQVNAFFSTFGEDCRNKALRFYICRCPKMSNDRINPAQQPPQGLGAHHRCYVGGSVRPGQVRLG